MPGFKFTALVEFFLKEDRTEEGLETIEDSLEDAGTHSHPFLSSTFKLTVLAYARALNTVTKSETKEEAQKPRIPDNLPIEEKKRMEAQEQGKAYRVPEWWVGERKAAKIAQSMMGTIPKKIGPVDQK